MQPEAARGPCIDFEPASIVTSSHASPQSSTRSRASYTAHSQHCIRSAPSTTTGERTGPTSLLMWRPRFTMRAPHGTITGPNGSRFDGCRRDRSVALSLPACQSFSVTWVRPSPPSTSRRFPLQHHQFLASVRARTRSPTFRPTPGQRALMPPTHRTPRGSTRGRRRRRLSWPPVDESEAVSRLQPCGIWRGLRHACVIIPKRAYAWRVHMSWNRSPTRS